MTRGEKASGRNAGGYGASDMDDVVFDHELTPDERAFIDAHGTGDGSHGCCGGDSCTCDDGCEGECGDNCGDGCSCGHHGHSTEERAAAEEFRESHRMQAEAERAADEQAARNGTGKRPLQHMIVVSFSSTFDAMEAERLCQEAGVPGRIIPLPVQITAECGLAWSMPCSGDALAAFRAAVDGAVVPEDYHQLML